MIYAMFEMLFFIWLTCFVIVPSFLWALAGARTIFPSRRWPGLPGCESGSRNKRGTDRHFLPGAGWPLSFAPVLQSGENGHVFPRGPRRRAGEPLLITAMELRLSCCKSLREHCGGSQCGRAAATGPPWRCGPVAAGRSAKMDRRRLPFAASCENERRRA